MISSLIQTLLLVSALSLDALVASFSYGAGSIKIPFLSVLILDLICSATLGVALLLGDLIGQWIPAQLTLAICFVLLFVLGVTKLFSFLMKNWILHSDNGIKRVSFRLLDYRFILKIYADSTQADRDHSMILSPKESIALAVALSLDGCAAGFGAGLMSQSVLIIVLESFVINMLAIEAGSALGARFARNRQIDLSWLGCVILILLAFWKLF